MLSYYVINYEKFKQVMQRTEKVGLKLYLHPAAAWYSDALFCLNLGDTRTNNC